MPKPHIILIHGMGEHEEDSFKETLLKPLDAASEKFASLGKFSDSVELHYIDYNSLIADVRTYMKQASVADLGNKFPGAPSIVSKINELNLKFAESDSFWATHLLDVLLYRSFFADAIQASVGKQLIAAMKAANAASADVHIVCHSLGTAVMHDTLHKLYTNSLNDEQGTPLLSAGLNKIQSITMIANVSQLPITEANPYTSCVKPGPLGICNQFITCRHSLDPIASIVKFEPGANWPQVMGSEFRNLVIKDVERANVHDIDHYFADPKVFMSFFMAVFKSQFITTAAEVNNAIEARNGQTLQGKFDALKAELADADITVYWDEEENDFVFSDDAQNLYKNIAAFRDHLENIKGQIDNLQGAQNNE